MTSLSPQAPCHQPVTQPQRRDDISLSSQLEVMLSLLLQVSGREIFLITLIREWAGPG